MHTDSETEFDDLCKVTQTYCMIYTKLREILKLVKHNDSNVTERRLCLERQCCSSTQCYSSRHKSDHERCENETLVMSSCTLTAFEILDSVNKNFQPTNKHVRNIIPHTQDQSKAKNTTVTPIIHIAEIAMKVAIPRPPSLKHTSFSEGGDLLNWIVLRITAFTTSPTLKS